MNFKRKLIILIGALSILLILSSGCISFITPDYDSYSVSYIRVIPYYANVKMYTSKTFTVKAYDSEGYSIPVDPSKVYWSCTYQCPALWSGLDIKPRERVNYNILYSRSKILWHIPH